VNADAFVHPSAEVDTSVGIGPGTKIWHLVQIRPGVSIGANCVLGRDVYIDEGIQIGDNVKIQNRASIYKQCVIESGVFIGPHVCFTNDLIPRAINPDGSLKSADDWTAGSTRVGYGASIGASSVILPSRSIGRFAMVGAGSVVTRDVPDHALVVGNPARQVGFVCRCGTKLTSVTEDRLECVSCGEQY
jgi:acetyltransferase-like isoleucine patch superfamily enzyme